MTFIANNFAFKQNQQVKEQSSKAFIIYVAFSFYFKIKKLIVFRCLKKPKPKPIENLKLISPDVVDDSQKKVEIISSKSVESPTEISNSVSSTSNEIPASSEQNKMRSPSLDEMVANTLEPMVKTTGNNIDLSDILNPLTEIRQRAAAMGPCGKIKVGLVFDSKREELKVTIYEAKGLPGGDLPDPPDPYVKLYLLPGKKKITKA